MQWPARGRVSHESRAIRDVDCWGSMKEASASESVEAYKVCRQMDVNECGVAVRMKARTLK